MVRCKELGLTLPELDVLEYGMIVDMLIEKHNDSEEYDQIATQEDFDKF